VIPAIDLRGGRCVRLLRGDFAQETVFRGRSGRRGTTLAGGGASGCTWSTWKACGRGSRATREAIDAVLRAVTIPCRSPGRAR
jgi:phosphoribosylformimino-5-aminoimidazole carboxamide ribotide isomerase